MNVFFREKQMKMCADCHWRDKNPKLCRRVEPPIEKYVDYDKGRLCGYHIYDSYWDRIPQEQKDQFNEDVRQRSISYYKNTGQAC